MSKFSQFYQLKLEQIMEKEVANLPLIEEHASISKAMIMLKKHDHLWVVKDLKSRVLVGVVTNYDMLRFFSPRKKVPIVGLIKHLIHYTPGEIREIMHYPITCNPAEKISDAIKKMIAHRIRRIPVVKNHQIIGEITSRQIIKEFISRYLTHL